MNKKTLTFGVLIVLGVLIVIFGISMISGYNTLVKQEVDVDGKFANIDIALAERHTLIGQTVATVTGLQEHAEDIYEMITDARAAYAEAKANNDIEGLVEADLLESLAMSELYALVVVEDNPNISAAPAFMQLIDSISSTEGELAYARWLYNKSVEDYNKSVRLFPRVIFANMVGFDKEKTFWLIGDEMTEVPPIDFGND